jgi:hypothetical protein
LPWKRKRRGLENKVKKFPGCIELGVDFEVFPLKKKKKKEVLGIQVVIE